MGRALARTCKRAWSGAARPAFIVALLVLVPVCVILIRSVPRALPTNTITVNSTADPGPTADCDLRDAITAANTDLPVNGCIAGTGTDTINFNLSGPIVLSSTLPAIANASPGSLTIDGTGQTIAVNGDSLYQVFVVNSGATLNLNNLTITGGSATSSPAAAGSTALERLPSTTAPCRAIPLPTLAGASLKTAAA